MMCTLITPARLSVVVATLFAMAASAAPAAPRTFVASYGIEPPANVTPCALKTPCRTFNSAISMTDPGGEVVILDTAGYGPMTIDKAIKIVAPAGVYGGISVTAGGNGVTINAGDNDNVILRGLDIVGVAGPP